MNARQKAKHYKKKLEELQVHAVEAVGYLGSMCEGYLDELVKVDDSHVTCTVTKKFDHKQEIDEDLAIDIWEQLTYDPSFRQAVVIDQYQDYETGRWIVAARLTVVKPDVDLEEMED